MKIRTTWLLAGLWLVSTWAAAQPQPLAWTFPLPRPHTGMLVGNGTQGLMIWGKKNQLNVTVGRAGFWDRRGGNDFSARTTYQEVKRLLEAKDDAGLKKAFEVPAKAPNLPKEPQQIGGGRLELILPDGWILVRGELVLAKGEARVEAKDPQGKPATIRIRQAVPDELALIELPASLQGKVRCQWVPSWEHVKAKLAPVGVQPPDRWQSPASTGEVVGFTQSLPADEPLALAYQVRGRQVLVGSHLGSGCQKEVIQKITTANPANLEKAADAWWKNYWAEVPKVTLPDPVLQETIDYGLYKQACVTPPHGVAATLQGAFNEEYQLPPWSNDYHFNINIQMIYLPALATNRPDHLKPVWAMLKQWMPQLRANGKQFFGREGAVMLPHAVDDRCQVVGTFWTGTIDHGCTAWMAQLAWQHYRYTMDAQLLRETAYPLLVGAFEGYWAMLERGTDAAGKEVFSLPVSVSPEYRGSRMDAWGKNASFQLAALHCVAELLPQAAGLLGEALDPRWQEVQAKLPPYSTAVQPIIQEFDWFGANKPQIALWDGLGLIESHRHHSHLAGIYPFKTYDPASPGHRDIVQQSLQNWTAKGMGAWSGWCLPWAAILRARVNQSESAIGLLHWWRRNFCNEGRGTLHDSFTPGLSVLASPVRGKIPEGQPNNEIMQMDAGFGALSAVCELLLQERRDGIYVFPDIPLGWQSASFAGLRTEGAFLVSAKVAQGQTVEVRVKATHQGKLRLVHGLGEKWVLNGAAQAGPVLERDCAQGEELVLRRQ